MSLAEAAGLAATVTQKAFMDIKIGKKGEPKRVVIGLFGDVVPKTVENFAQLCTGQAGTGNNWMPLHYKGSTIHRIVQD